MKTSFNLPKPDILLLMLALFVMSAGLFHDFAACFAGAFIAVYLIITVVKNKQFVFRLNLLSIACAVFVLFYGISTLWAVDKGSAFIGFLKFLPVLLFLLCIMQKEECVKTAESFLPYLAALFVIITSILGLIPGLSELFYLNERLCGFLQYPNTFAIFLLVSALLLFSKKRFCFWDVIVFLIILFGIFCTGSRTVFIITVLCGAVLCIFSKNKQTRFIFICAAVIAAILILLLGTVLSGAFTLDRFKEVSLKDVSRSGRFIFAADALKLIFKNPFGLGYMGYFFTHRSVQSVPYTVTNVHNELLQFILDTGLIAGVLMFAALLLPIFSKNEGIHKRLALAALLLHSLFDFDFQFVAIFFIALLIAYRESGRVFTIKLSFETVGLLAVSTFAFLYCGIALTLYAVGNFEGCHALYPWYTQNEIQLLLKTDDAKSMDAKADYILSLNDKVSVAYSAKARAAYSSGDFEKVIACKQKVFSLTPLSFIEYQDYCYMLIDGIRLYRQAGDEYSAGVCKAELLKTKATVEGLNDNRTGFTKNYYRVRTKLNDDILEFIESEA